MSQGRRFPGRDQHTVAGRWAKTERVQAFERKQLAICKEAEAMKEVWAITRGGARQKLPDLRGLLVEASQALARLDSDRLEELALSCQALNRDFAPANVADRAGFACQVREAAGEMAVFARVLEATRSNLNVMKRLRELRAGRLEYGESPARGWAETESAHGND
jgi:hypothetical protein